MTLIDNEPLLRDYEDYLSIFPIKFQDLWSLYKKAQRCFWTPEELRLNDDIEDWNNHLSESERATIKYVLAFFAGADSIVNENLVFNFYPVFQVSEIRCFYGFQIMMENFHGEAYSAMIDTYISDSQEKEKLLNIMKYQQMPSVQKMYQWSKDWVHRQPDDDSELAYIHNIAYKLVAFACVEGLMFSPLFVVPFWGKNRGILPGFAQSNELINRDEALHFRFATVLFSYIKNKPPFEKVDQIITQARQCSVELARESMDSQQGRGLRDMTAEQMIEYLYFMEDVLLTLLGYSKKHNYSSCPIPFMERISMSGKTNFFERSVTEYNVGEDDREELQELEDF